ncbi:hypothetical protein TEA_021721 [Camellia sinensis var. sinensis]|uniref:Auxin-responsive protein n=1 Tax=Camellia sinensis var. sinensis TaxID=542762 RepID=A0A4S4DZJ0_CAMSN|nr:hypothetical protein TEA_021721 [Camellia sinensis var. sinensis]
MERGRKMKKENENLNFEETELRLGLPGGGRGGEGDHVVVMSTNNNGKRGFEEDMDLKLNLSSKVTAKPPAAKAQVVGWPPVRSFRKNILAVQKSSSVEVHDEVSAGAGTATAAFVKVSMDGAPYLRKVDLRMYNTYQHLSHALANMFSSFTIGKAQVVGWPPVRSFRKNILAVQKSSSVEVHDEVSAGAGTATAAFVKVSMDGAPYLRKVDLRMYNTYQHLSHALANMFSSFTIGNCGSQGMKDFMNERRLIDLLSGSDYVPTYEDIDGDWMLLGDVPWE